MAISFVDNYIVFADTSGTTLTLFRPTYSTGDMLIAFIGGKAYNTTITAPAGWTSIGSSTNGTTASGIDTGSTFIQVFYKIAGASEPSSYSFTTSINRTIVMGMIHSYNTTLNWNTPVGSGALNTTSTGWNTINSVSTLNLPIGAYIPIVFVSNTDATSITTLPILDTSPTSLKSFASYSAEPITNYTTSNGDDGGMVTGYTSVTGSLTNSPVTMSINSSGSSSEKGHAYIVVLTDYGGAGNDPFGQFGVFGI